jgi:hypothetical protein
LRDATQKTILPRQSQREADKAKNVCRRAVPDRSVRGSEPNGVRLGEQNGCRLRARADDWILPEMLMLALRVVCLLSAVVCVGARADGCSGGASGGIDATGNQCSAPGRELDPAERTPVVARIVATTATPDQPLLKSSGSRSTSATAQGPQIAAATTTLGRLPRSAKPPAEPVRSAKMDTSAEASCSGGSGGGMDATGNQCSPVGPADGVAIALIPAR